MEIRAAEISAILKEQIANFGADLAGKVRRIEERYAVDAALSGEEVFPERIHIVTERGDDTEAGDHDTLGGRQVGFHEGR